MTPDILLKVVCAQRWDIAAATTWRETIKRGARPAFHENDDTWFDRVLAHQDHAISRSASERMSVSVRRKHPDLALCWALLAVDPQKPGGLLDLVTDILTMVRVADLSVREWPEFFPRLRVIRDVANNKHAGAFGSIFHLATMNHQNVATGQALTSIADDDVSIPVRLLIADSWESAHAQLIAANAHHFTREGKTIPDRLRDRTMDRVGMRAIINVFADDVFNIGVEWAGELAIGWRMLAADPAWPETLHSVMPPLTQLFYRGNFDAECDKATALARLDIWWGAARGDFRESRIASMFDLAATEHGVKLDDGKTYCGDDDEPAAEPPSFLKRAALAANKRKSLPQGPSVVVMRGKHAEERGLPAAWKEMRDKALPLVVVRDVHLTRAALELEFPHAEQAINLLTRDLREGQPARMHPMILLGEPGGGKTRMVRRLADLLGIYAYRYDGASAHDGTYAGTAKAWSTSHPSAPARAIMMSQSANPIVMVDEIEKAGSSTHNGNLWSAMTPFLERETAARYREGGIDAELDLSHVCHIATANSIDHLPGPLRDRFRIVLIPRPTLVHLPALAEQVMLDLAADDEERRYDEPLAPDEIEIIGRAWKREQFSLRKLQRMVAATLEARDHYAARH